MTTNFILPIFLFAIFLAAFRGQNQAILMVLVSPYVTDSLSFTVIICFGFVSFFYGQWRSAHAGN